MIDLSTNYLGLALSSPLVPSSSPLSRDLSKSRQLEDAGASALVMHSLFEEAIEKEQLQLERFVHFQSLGHMEADSYHPIPDQYKNEVDGYLEQLSRLKETLNIPVIASLNGTSHSGWIEYGKELEAAGADAIELNVYYVAADPTVSGEEVEQRYVDLLLQLKTQVNIPIGMKIASQFSSVGHLIKRLEMAGADGVAMFNRFYQPDIDLETLHITPSLHLSSPHEALLRIRWVALLRHYLRLSLAVTGGFHRAPDILKALLAGADVSYLCSALLTRGPDHITKLREEIVQWMEEKEYASVEQLKGSLSRQCAINPAVYEHANYLEVLDHYNSALGLR
jgi:dihydroorotate dehydrogenase (fumarate)